MDVNSIANLSMAMAQRQIMTEVNVRVLRMQMDQMQQMQANLEGFVSPCPTIANGGVPVSVDPTVGQVVDFYA